MAAVIDILSWASIIIGTVFTLIGGIGLLRLPDMFTRMHGASLIDTMGIGMGFFGLMLQAGFTLVTAKLILILVFIFFTGPAATHALARAALIGGSLPLVDDESRKHAAATLTMLSGDDISKPD